MHDHSDHAWPARWPPRQETQQRDAVAVVVSRRRTCISGAAARSVYEAPSEKPSGMKIGDPMAMTFAVALLALTVFLVLVGWVISRQWPSPDEIARQREHERRQHARGGTRRGYDTLRDVTSRVRGVTHGQRRR